MIESTGLERVCIVADSAQQMKEEIKKYIEADFTAEEISKRESTLSAEYSNRKNAENLVSLLFQEE